MDGDEFEEDDEDIHSCFIPVVLVASVTVATPFSPPPSMCGDDVEYEFLTTAVLASCSSSSIIIVPVVPSCQDGGDEGSVPPLVVVVSRVSMFCCRQVVRS